MPLLNLLNQLIVLVDLFMINITPNIFYFRFVFLAYYIFSVNLDYFFSRAVFLAISPLVPCGNTALSLQCVFLSCSFYVVIKKKNTFSRAYLPICLRAYMYILRTYVPSCLKLFRAHVVSFFTCLRAYNHSGPWNWHITRWSETWWKLIF